MRHETWKKIGGGPMDQRERIQRQDSDSINFPNIFKIQLTLLLSGLLLLVGCLAEKNNLLPAVRSAPIPPGLNISLDWPLGQITPWNPAMVRFTRENGPGFDYDYQLRLDTAGVHLVTSIPPGTYIISAFVDLNDTQDLEAGGDAIAGQPAAWYDPLQTVKVTVPEHGVNKLTLRFLHPLKNPRPAPGTIGAGTYPVFEWTAHPLIPLYDLRVWRKEDDILYRVRTIDPAIRYGNEPPANAGTLFTWPRPMAADEWYYWDITGVNAAGYAVAYTPSLRFIP